MWYVMVFHLGAVFDGGHVHARYTPSFVKYRAPLKLALQPIMVEKQK